MALFIAASVVLVATAFLVAATFRLSWPATVLTTYLVASTEVVLLAEALSPFHAIRPGSYAVGELLTLAAAVWLWRRRGSPLPPRPRVRVRALLRHPIVLVLLVVVAGALAFEAFVTVSAAPNNWDSMTYHLSRAAAWYQRGSIGYIHSHSARQNVFPGNAEIQVLYTLVFLGRDVLAAAPQFLAQLAVLVAVFGIARRLAFDRAAAAFAALVCATLSEVVLQATTTQNDLVVAAYVATAVYFVLGGARRELPLAGLAVGLALGTKLSALFALPIVAVLAAATLPRRRIAELALAVAIGFAATGAVFYGLNQVHSGTPLGDASARKPFQPRITPSGTASTAARSLYRFVDLSGWNADIRIRVTIMNDGIALFDALRIPAEPLESTQTPFYFLPNIRAHEDVSWFGPLGAFLILPLAFGFLGAWCLRRTTRARGLLAAALPLYTVEIALAYKYNEWIGRFMLIPVTLVVALVARVYAARIVSAGVAVVGAGFLTLALATNETKPVGLDGKPAIWNMSRPQAQSISLPVMADTLDSIERVVPQDASVGVRLGEDDWDYPLYGPRLTRHIVTLPDRAPLATATRRGIGWVLIGSRGLSERTAPGAWIGYRFAGTGWWLLARRGTAAARRMSAAFGGGSPTS